MGMIMFVLKWALIVFALIVVLLIGVGIYFYNFHVFKTVVFCVSANPADTGLSCSMDSNCTDYLNRVSELKNVTNQTNISSTTFALLDNARNLYVLYNESLMAESSPVFVRVVAQQILSESFSCSETKKVCEFRSVSNNLFDAEKKCGSGEKEINIKIHGKEGIQLLRFMKDQKVSRSMF